MRITNNMLAQNSLWNINNNLRRLGTAQDKLSTQSKIQLPSDDPIVATRALKYRNYVSSVEQYQRNIDDATSWMEVSESALGQLGEVLHRVKDLTIQASSTSSISDADKKAIKSEISTLRDNVIDIMNTSYAGRYVFGGFATDQPPYKIESTSLGEKVTYKGHYVSVGGPVSNSISDADLITYCQANLTNQYHEPGKQQMQYNTGFGSEIAVNVEGQNIIGQEAGSNLFDVFDKLLLGLDGNTQYKAAEITGTPPTVTAQTKDLNLSDLLGDLDKNLNLAITVRTDLGARMNYVDRAKTKIESDYTTYMTLMSNNEDVDVAQASVEAKSAEYTYNASLAVGSKAITQSLIDYIK
ncbi:flagellar hook-associated protein FlgL [Sporomusa malonica]|uniref:Flagellar hook-associated protein 3 FlgL n=1 Tax=Sporomusa malonica TaxID=112901 RepID=A0A1W2DFB5_9FIRM|nr:flagellar hook-associated protein FlgL [Sporomusa malonica]SMC96173.1 flagellar hook-associated protein 3 FlgL [Sporomusa malonica]